MDLILDNIQKNVSLNKEYNNMLEHINKYLPAVENDSQNFFKSETQYKTVTLDITDLTPMSSLRHILASIQKTKMAIEEATINCSKKEIELKKKQIEIISLEDGYSKDLMEIEIIELKSNLNNIANSIQGAIRKLSYLITQYNSILTKMNKTEITEQEVEVAEEKYHIMTAMKQALTAARTRGGVIDEGNHIYLFDMGINGAVAQVEIFTYLKMEEEMLHNGQLPTHQMTVEWLEACAEKFKDCGKNYAESRGFISLDKKSLVKEIEN
jgi:hypothetical protein